MFEQPNPALLACTGGPLVLPVVWGKSPVVPRGICSGFRLSLPWSLQCPEGALSKVAFATLSGMWQQPWEQVGGDNWGCV